MAQDKRVFTGGMDKDSEPRLIKNGDYRDALNIRNMSSSDSTSGSVENIEGNTLIPYTFITETDQLIEVESSDGHVVIEEIGPEDIYHQWTIIFNGREVANEGYASGLAYATSDNNFEIIQASTLSWFGNSFQTNTAANLYSIYGPGGPLNTINVQNYLSGGQVTIQAELDFNSDSVFDPAYESPFSITFTALSPNNPFTLQMYGGNAGVNAGGDPFTNDLSDFFSTDVEQLGSGMFATYAQPFTGDVPVGGSVDNSPTTFGPGPGVGSTNTSYDFLIGGAQPTSGTTAETTTNLFSYDLVGEPDSPDGYLVSEVLDLQSIESSLEVGGEFEFDSNQDSFSQAFINAIDKGDFGNVLISGGNGATTSIGSIQTDFLSTTSLKGSGTSASRNDSSTSSYNQLEYYYGSDEVIEGDGFSILDGTLTFSGEEVLSNFTYPLNANLIKDKNYLLTFTVSGLEATGTSFEIISGNTSIGSVSTNGNKTFYFKPTGNSSIIYLKFKDDFSSSDSFTITSLRLFLEDVPVSSLTIKISSINSSKFNLAFASSSEELKSNLAAGKTIEKIPEWFAGCSLELQKKSIGSGDVTNLGGSIAELQEQLAQAQVQITGLQNTMSSLSSTHATDLAALQSQLDIATANLQQVQDELEAANTLNSVLNSELGNIYQSYIILVDAINNLDDTANLTAYANNLGNISLGLSAINEALTSLSVSSVTNESLQEEIASYIEINNGLTSELEQSALDLATADQTIINLNNTINSNNTSLSALHIKISDLEASLEAALENQEDGISQSDLNLLQATHDILITDLTSQHNEQITSLEEDKEVLQNAANEALIVFEDMRATLLSVEAQLDAAMANQEDGITQADVDAIQALLDAAVLEDGITQADVDEVQVKLDAALLNQEDGITQDDVDAIQEILDNALDTAGQASATAASHVLSLQAQIDGLEADIAATILYHEENPTILDLTEYVDDTTFQDESKWTVGNGWAFDEKGATFKDGFGSGAAYSLYQVFNPSISPGEYILSFNCSAISVGSYFQIRTGVLNSGGFYDYTSHGYYSTTGRQALTINIINPSDSIQIKPFNSSADFSISELSLSQATGESSVTSETITSLLEFTTTLKESNSALTTSNNLLISTIIGNGSGLVTADEAIETYTSNLLLTADNLTSLQTSLLGVISELNITDTITQAALDALEADYNDNTNNLNAQISTLTELVLLLQGQITDTLNNDGLSSNEVDKWMMTFSGGVPVRSETVYGNSDPINLLIKLPGYEMAANGLQESMQLFMYGYETNNYVRGNSYTSSSTPLSTLLKQLASKAISNYNTDLLDDDDNPMEFPVVFYIPFISLDGGSTKQIKVIVHSIEPTFTVNHGGTKIISDKGDTPILHPSDYLTAQDVDNGVQIEFEAVDGSTGWEFYTKLEGSETLLTSGSKIQLGLDYVNDYSWSINDDSIPAPNGLDYSLYFEQVQVQGSGYEPEGAETRGTVGNFIASVISPDYSMSDLEVSDNFTYPSGSSDIILNKSFDVKPNLSDSVVGAKIYIKNTLLNKTTVRDNSSEDYKCIGTYEDKPGNSIYYFVNNKSSNKYSCILEYNLIDDKVRTVYQDGRRCSNGEFETILDFSEDYLITGVNKIDDILYWTDNLNRPRKINVKLAKASEVNIANATTFVDANWNGNDSSVFLSYDSQLHNNYSIGDDVYTDSYTSNAFDYNGYAEVLGIVRLIPEGVTLTVATSGDTFVTSSVALNDSTLEAGEWIGIMDDQDFPRFYQVQSISGTTINTVEPIWFTVTNAEPLEFDGNNIGGLITNCPFQSYDVVPGIILKADPSDAYSPLINYGDYKNKMLYFDAVKHQPNNRPSIIPDEDPGYAKNNLLDDLFQFKYRNIHQDKENTAYSSISDIEIDDEFARNTPLTHVEYALTKNMLKVYYSDDISDVKKIEIVARKGNNGEFFLIDTVENNFIKYLKELKNEVITSPDYYFDIDRSFIKFRNNGIYPFVNKSESDKLFDAVPKLAKAQTIISDNRLSYGNVLEGYDNTPLVLKSEFSSEGMPQLTTDINGLKLYNLSDYSEGEGDQLFEQNYWGSSGSFVVENSPLALLVFGGNNTGSTDPNESIWQPGPNKNLRLSLYLDLTGIELNLENSQYLSFDVSFVLQREAGGTPLGGGKSKKRVGRISMNVDVTGLDTINQVRVKVVDQFNLGNWDGGTAGGTTSVNDCIKDEGGESNVSLSSYGATYLKLRWVHKNNNEYSDSAAGLSSVVWSSPPNWEKAKLSIKGRLVSGSPGISSFKSGAFHDFGIAYFDETNRCSFVNAAPDYGIITLQDGYNDASLNVNLNGTRPYNYFPTEIGGPEVGQSTKVNFEIYNKPPVWATSYQFLYSGNTSVSDFMQVTVPFVIPGSGNGDNQMYLSLQSLKGHKSSYTEATPSLVDFDVAEGDRIRFISCDVNGTRQRFSEYLDFPITGFDYYQDSTAADVDVQPITTTAGQGGFYISIPNPGNQAVTLLDGTASEVVFDHTGFSLNGSGYDLLVAELYRPKKTVSPESMVYYEIGDRMEIGNPGEADNYHTGNEDQDTEYFYDKDVNTLVSLSPAKISIESGDIYIKPRNMFTQQDGSSFEIFSSEDYYLNDFHNTNHYDKGRINVINNNAEERRLDTSVYYSETYVSTGSINGLSSFNLANSPFFDYNKEFGSIQSLKTNDNDLIVFHESKVGRVLVGKDVLTTASGAGLVSLSNNVIDNYVTLYSGQFGCGLNPESIVKHNNKFYFADIRRGSILRLSTDGLTIISDYGMKDYFRDIGELYIKYNPDKIATFYDSLVNSNAAPYALIGGYDPKYDEYIITIPGIEGGRNYSTGNAGTVKNWSEGILNWDDSTSLINLKTDKTIFNPVSIGFSEATNKWTSFYSFVPDFYSKINRQFVSFKLGRIYRHNDSDIYSRSQTQFNKFYGNHNLSYIDFVFNIEPSTVKTYNAIGLESDTKFITGMFSNMGQYYGNYDDVITTGIAFRKVEGTVKNHQGTTSNFISGVGTAFYEDVAPGDLVRVFGLKDRAYMSKNFIVTKVVSNNLIIVNEPLNLDIDGSYMLVIDYKTKEGIQYSSIPFAGSGVQSNQDNVQFGDGSEITGLGTPRLENLFGDSMIEATGPNVFNDVNLTLTNNITTPVSMVSGAEYVIYSLNNSSTFNVSSIDPSLDSQDGVVGQVFTSKYSSSNSDVSIVPTNRNKLYFKSHSNNDTTFLGYVVTASSSKVLFIKKDNYVSVDLPTGFLFIVKNGNVEGERMKGSYMRTILATNKDQSKRKFNLYAANVDIDKSGLSGSK
mgnify:FL=1|tara:strand:+ start:1551 stop:11414 length:9864 start_codon:yes stop_codon:yes gene_type:complete